MGLTGLEALFDPRLGAEVKTSQTSWVRRSTAGARSFYVKTYVYPRWRDRVRGLCRNTFLARSRAAREWDALTWLREHGFPGVRPVGVAETRRAGWLVAAALVTEGWDGQTLDQLLPCMAAGSREQVARQVMDLVQRLHEQGFRHRNLDLRNLLARPGQGTVELAMIDAPRYVLRAAGRPTDRLARADWDRLLPQLQQFWSGAVHLPRG